MSNQSQLNLQSLLAAMAENHNMLTNQAQAFGLMLNNHAELLKAINDNVAQLGGDDHQHHHHEQAAGPTPAALANKHPAASEAASRLVALTQQFKADVNTLRNDVNTGGPTRRHLNGGPTPAAPALPTPVVNQKNPDEQAARAALVERFVGPRSMFVNYLAPSVINMGRGYVAPNKNLGTYTEDILVHGDPTNWPSGFYTNEVNGESQLFINTKSVMVFIDGLPSFDAKVGISLKGTHQAGSVGHMRYVEDVDTETLMFIAQIVSEFLEAQAGQ
jgi:hypothetical protein